MSSPTEHNSATTTTPPLPYLTSGLTLSMLPKAEECTQLCPTSIISFILIAMILATPSNISPNLKTNHTRLIWGLNNTELNICPPIATFPATVSTSQLILVDAVQDIQIERQQVIGTVETLSGTQSIHINLKTWSPFPSFPPQILFRSLCKHSSQLLSKHEKKQKLIDVMMPATWIGQERDMIKPIKHTSLNTQMWIYT